MQKIMQKQSAFTLIELIIGVGMVTLLTIFVFKLYLTQIRKGRRMDGINVLLSISLAEERYRSDNATYGTLTEVWGGVNLSPGGYYNLSISHVSSTGYKATAVTQGDQINDAAKNTPCRELNLSVSNGIISKSPEACWPS